MALESALVHGGDDANGCDIEQSPTMGVLAGGLRMLLTAEFCASDAGEDAWYFAVEIDHLREAGVIDPWLRWLVIKSYLFHRAETTLFGQQDRTFRDIGRLRFCPESCFVLTAAGAAFARSVCEGAQRPQHRSPAILSVPHTEAAKNGAGCPVWDGLRKELWMGGQVVKRFRVQSPNQETVLMAFEEEGWPARIDDPLPPASNVCPKRRLHDAIKNLNRHQLIRLIAFQGDGTGEGVLWQAVTVNCSASPNVPGSSP